MEGTVIYGLDPAGDYLVFVPEDVAVELRLAHDVVQTARTWGALRAGLPDDRVEQVLAWFFEDAEAHEAPANDEDFDLDSFGAYHDRDWPDWPAQLQLECLPADVQALGTVEDSTLNGRFLAFAPEKEAEVAAALERHGFTVRRDQGLLDLAAGGVVRPG